MKTRLIATVLAVVALLSSNVAYATCKNGATNYPQCNNQPPTPPATPTPTSSTSTANASSTSQSSANSASSAHASQGQHQGQGQSQGQSMSGSGNSDVTVGVTEGSSSSSYKNNMWVFPAPVFTPPLPLIQNCPGANVEQHATAVGWNFVSHARATVNTDNCTAITLYNSYVSTCKYQSAQQVLDLLTRKILPDFQRSEVALMDLTKKECDMLSMPVVVPPVQYVQTAAPVLTCNKGQKRNSRGVCYTPQTLRPQSRKCTADTRILVCHPA
jgi:hypothetical protein